jgi:hypothetical protein
MFNVRLSFVASIPFFRLVHERERGVCMCACVDIELARVCMFVFSGCQSLRRPLSLSLSLSLSVVNLYALARMRIPTHTHTHTHTHTLLLFAVFHCTLLVISLLSLFWHHSCLRLLVYFAVFCGHVNVCSLFCPSICWYHRSGVSRKWRFFGN